MWARRHARYATVLYAAQDEEAEGDGPEQVLLPLQGDVGHIAEAIWPLPIAERS